MNDPQENILYLYLVINQFGGTRGKRREGVVEIRDQKIQIGWDDANEEGGGALKEIKRCWEGVMFNAKKVPGFRCISLGYGPPRLAQRQ